MNSIVVSNLLIVVEKKDGNRVIQASDVIRAFSYAESIDLVEDPEKSQVWSQDWFFNVKLPDPSTLAIAVPSIKVCGQILKVEVCPFVSVSVLQAVNRPVPTAAELAEVILLNEDRNVSLCEIKTIEIFAGYKIFYCRPEDFPFLVSLVSFRCKGVTVTVASVPNEDADASQFDTRMLVQAVDGGIVLTAQQLVEAIEASENKTVVLVLDKTKPSVPNETVFLCSSEHAKILVNVKQVKAARRIFTFTVLNDDSKMLAAFLHETASCSNPNNASAKPPVAGVENVIMPALSDVRQSVADHRADSFPTAAAASTPAGHTLSSVVQAPSSKNLIDPMPTAAQESADNGIPTIEDCRPFNGVVSVLRVSSIVNALKKHYEISQDHEDRSSAPFSEADMMILFLHVHNQLKEQCLDSAHVETLFFELQQNYNSMNREQLISLTSRLLTSIQPLDIERMVELIEMTESACFHVYDKDIVLMLGPTGAGKSTTIHFLAGSTLKHVEIHGFECIEVESLDSPNLADVKVGHSTRSETRFIKAAKITTRGRNVILCDSPGFDDTNGPEVNIANGIGIIKALRGCRSVKPVLLMSSAHVDRKMKGFRSLSTTLGAMVKSLPAVIDSFDYLFTGFFEKAPNLSGRFATLLSETNQDIDLTTLTRDIMSKIPHGARVLNPLIDDRQTLLERLTSSTTISDPSLHFRNFVAPESALQISSQLHVLRSKAQLAMERKKFGLLFQTLRQINTLTFLDIQDCGIVLNEILDTVKRFWTGTWQVVRDRMQTAMHLGNIMVDDDLEKAVQGVAYLVDLDSIGNHFLGEGFANIAAEAISFLRDNQLKLRDDFQPPPPCTTYDQSSSSNQFYCPLLCEEVAQRLSKMQLIDSFACQYIGNLSLSKTVNMQLDEIRNTFITYTFKVREEFDSIHEFISSCLNSFELEEISIALNTVLSCKSFTSIFRDMTYVDTKYAIFREELEIELKDSWKDAKSSFRTLLEKTTTVAEEEEATKAIKKFSNYLVAFKSSLNLQRHLNQEVVDKIENDSTDAVSSFLREGFSIAIGEYECKISPLSLIAKLEKLSHWIQTSKKIVDIDAFKALNFKWYEARSVTKNLIRDASGAFETAWIIFKNAPVDDVMEASSVFMQLESAVDLLYRVHILFQEIDSDGNLYGQEYTQVIKAFAEYINYFACNLPSKADITSDLQALCFFNDQVHRALAIKRILVVIDTQKINNEALFMTVVSEISRYITIAANVILDAIRVIEDCIKNLDTEQQLDFVTIYKSLTFFDVLVYLNVKDWTLIDIGEREQELILEIKKCFAKISNQMRKSFAIVDDFISLRDSFQIANDDKQAMICRSQISRAISHCVTGLQTFLSVLDFGRSHSPTFAARMPPFEDSYDQSLTNESMKNWCLFRKFFHTEPHDVEAEWMRHSNSNVVVVFHTVKSAFDVSENETASLDQEFVARSMIVCDVCRVFDTMMRADYDVKVNFGALLSNVVMIMRKVKDEVELDFKNSLTDYRKYDRAKAQLILQRNASGAKETVAVLINGRFSEVNELYNMSLQSMDSAFQTSRFADKAITMLRQLSDIHALFVQFQDLITSTTASQMASQVMNGKEMLTKHLSEKNRLIRQQVEAGDYSSAIDTMHELEHFHRECSTTSHYISFDGKEEIINKCSVSTRESESWLLSYVEDKLRQLADADIDSYSKSPPNHLYSALQNVKEKRFNDFATNLHSSIASKITKLLIDARNISISCEEFDLVLKRIANCLSFIPLEVVQEVNPLLQTCSNELVSLRENELREENLVENDKKWEFLMEKLQHALGRGDQRTIQKYCDLLESQAKSECELVKNDFKNRNIVAAIEVFAPYCIAYNAYLLLLDKKNERKSQWSSASTHAYAKQHSNSLSFVPGYVEAVMTDFKNALSLLFTEVSTLPTNPDKFGQYDVASKALDCMVRLIVEDEAESILLRKFQRTYDDSKQRETLCKNMICALGNIYQFVIFVQKSIVDAVEKFAVPEIKKWMDVMQQGESFFKVVQSLKSTALKNPPSELEVIISKTKSYVMMRGLVAQAFFGVKEKLKVSYIRHPSTDVEANEDRDNFYIDQFKNYQLMRQLHLISSHLDQSIMRVEDITLLDKHIDDQLRMFSDEMLLLLPTFPTNRDESYKTFNIDFKNLHAFSIKFQDGILGNQARMLMDAIAVTFSKLLTKLKSDIMNEIDSNTLVRLLLEIKTVAIKISHHFTDTVNAVIDSALTDYARMDASKIGIISLELDRVKDPTAKALLMHKAFEAYQIIAKNEMALRFTIDDVVGSLSGDQYGDPHFFKSIYEKFDHYFWTKVENGSREIGAERDQYLRSLVNGTKTLVANTNADKLEKALEMLAFIFAYWTLHKRYSLLNANNAAAQVSDNNNNTSTAATANEFLAKKKLTEFLQPHAAQLVAIFRLLGLDCGNILENHLAQIKTGEGKSVTLAATAIYLSLEGYDVDCACYSQYLSNRDCMDFVHMFSAFGASSKIRYGSFNTICELFINRQINIRNCVEAFVPNDDAKLQASQAPTADHRRGGKSSTILLIDEVDVFLSEDFYGNRYRPFACLKHPKITTLLDSLWSIRNDKSKCNITVLQSSTQFKQVLAVYPSWDALLLDCLKLMWLDLRSFESQDYLVQDGRIAYKEQDGISLTAFYGYKTIFAYYKEVDAHNISRPVLESHICILLDCGAFAYAEIPKMYKNIIGVTGTLDTLSSKENELLSSVYGISKKTFVPSVYGSNQLIFGENNPRDIMIEQSQGYFIAIQEEITRRLCSVHDASKCNARAVLVFFESITKLRLFYKWCPIRNKVGTITEDVSTKEKELLIRQAVTAGSVTLLTQAFGRGTDFICYDSNLLNDGGVHVIQTFVSDLVSDEVQIKGRTARQGNRGSYSMVLLDSELEPFGITDEVIKEMRNTGNLYSTIKSYRDRRFASRFPDNIDRVRQISHEHAEAVEFATHLSDLVHSVRGSNRSTRKTASNKAAEYLLKFNAAPHLPPDIAPSRTICLMDATGSMNPLLQKAKNTVKVMFERTYDILKQEKVENSFELQFAVYRNYSSGKDLLLQYSPWASRPVDLESFMDSISVNGGQGNEAVEIGLWHVMEESKNVVSQVILIGDMPPNTIEEVGIRRHSDADWASTRFATPTFYRKELARIQVLQIPIHAFFVDSKAETAFREIAQATGGNTGMLDINSSAGADMLTDMITKQILNNVGGGGARGAQLVTAYTNRYGHIHSSHSSHQEG